MSEYKAYWLRDFSLINRRAPENNYPLKKANKQVIVFTANIGIIVIKKSKEKRVVTNTCRYSSKLLSL